MSVSRWTSGVEAGGGPRGLRTARLLSRIFTWGLPDDERRNQLAESDAYWESMAADTGSFRATLHAIRGIPSWLWSRLAARDTTTLPAALGCVLVAVGGVTAILQPAAYTARVKMLMGIASASLILGAITLLRIPRRIVIRRLRIPAVLAAIGFIGIGLNVPNATMLPDGTPTLESPLLDNLTSLSLLIIGVGCAAGAINGFFVLSRKLAIVGGAIIGLGLALLGVTQIVWGVWDAQIDLGLAAASIVAGLAALSLTHVLPRLRHLEFE